MFNVVCLTVGIAGLILAIVFGYLWYNCNKRLKLVELLYDNTCRANDYNVKVNDRLTIENRLLNLKINELS